MKTGARQIDYLDTEFTLNTRRDLSTHNRVLERSDVVLNSPNSYKEYSGFNVRRTFLNSDFTQGGRIVGPWCFETAEDRRSIEIGGVETCEEDFPGSHVSVLYLLEGKNRWPVGLDPYELTVGGFLMPRGTVKKAITIGLNTASPQEYASTVRHHLGSGLQPMAILRAFQEKHPAIAHHYLKGSEYGNRIQFYESEIMMNLIRYFTDREIPILTVYDSVIIAKPHHETLKRVMFDDELGVNSLHRVGPVPLVQNMKVA